MSAKRVAKHVHQKTGKKTYNEQPVTVDLRRQSKQKEHIHAWMNNPKEIKIIHKQQLQKKQHH
jgi:hypothetical protein